MFKIPNPKIQTLTRVQEALANGIKIICNVCGKLFATRVERNNHIKKFHRSDNSYKTFIECECDYSKSSHKIHQVTNEKVQKEVIQVNDQKDEKIDVIKNFTLIEPNMTKVLQSMPHVLVSCNGIKFSKMTPEEARLVKAEMFKYSQVLQIYKCELCESTFT